MVVCDFSGYSWRCAWVVCVTFLVSRGGVSGLCMGLFWFLVEVCLGCVSDFFGFSWWFVWVVYVTFLFFRGGVSGLCV